MRFFLLPGGVLFKQTLSAFLKRTSGRWLPHNQLPVHEIFLLKLLNRPCTLIWSTNNMDDSTSPPKEKRWSKSPDREMEVEGREHGTATGDDDSKDEESTTTGNNMKTYYYTAGNGRENEGKRVWDDPKRSGGGGGGGGEGGEGGSTGETSTAESSECSSSRGGEDGASDGSQQSFFTRLAGKAMGNRLVSRFWKEMPVEG